MFSEYASDSLHSQEMGDFITSSILAAVADGTVKKPWWVPSFSVRRPQQVRRRSSLAAEAGKRGGCRGKYLPNWETC
jgi:hypothetical protein